MGCFGRLLDMLLPPACLGCGIEGYAICPACVRSIPRLPRRIHQQQGPIKEIYVMTEYAHPLVKKSIRQLKFRYCRRIVSDLAPLFADCLAALPFPPEPLLCPVPLHFWRYNRRGFNQAELIAAAIANMKGFVSVPLLKRVRHTPPQARLSAAKRRLNLKGAFAVIVPADAATRTRPVFLIDDVASTASTLTECAKALKKAGYQNIFALVIARNALNG